MWGSDMDFGFADGTASEAGARAVSVVPVPKAAKDKIIGGLPDAAQTWLAATGYKAEPGEVCVVPATDGSIDRVLLGLSEASSAMANLWDWAVLPSRLPAGLYAIEDGGEGAVAACLGWALGRYKFDRYKSPASETADKARLLWPDGVDASDVLRQASGIALTRDLINRHASDLTPAALADAALELAGRFEAQATVIVGEDLLAENYPAIHAVGRAAAVAPRLIDIRWGDENAPKVTLVGKGVTFDSGGLDIKPSQGMLLMKKDMGGSAQVLGLAHMIMDARLPVRLRVLVPAVENAISGNAFHPRDVLATRKGISVEVGNTDAEGRLILADALAEADSESPEMILEWATLTGAARIALGTDVPALFANDDALADDMAAAGMEAEDPTWRLPLWAGYERALASKVADTSSTGRDGYGGAITAALFLKRFVSDTTPWFHIDLMAWNLTDRPGRPEGGEAMGIRAAYQMLRNRYGS